MKQNPKDFIVGIMAIISGNFIIAIGVTFFVLPLDILSGGVAGIAVALKPIFHVSPAFMINVITIGLYLLGAVILGKKFALKTILSTIVFPVFILLLNLFSDQIHITDNVLLASLYGGICTGVGIGLVFRVGASTGGMDIPPLIINKYTNIPLSTLVVCVDGATVLLGVSVYGIEKAMIGLISVWICGRMIDKIITFGGHEAKNVMIITEKHEQLIKEIYEDIHRGATILHAEGGYTREVKPVIMVVIVKKQFPSLNYLIARVDPEAFVIVSDVNEVQGEGFTYQEQI